MAQVLINPTIIAREALMQLLNNMVMGNSVHRQYVNEFVKVGNSITIRKPVKFTVNATADITNKLRDVMESTTTLTVSTQINVPWYFTSQELTMDVEKYSERYIQPAAIQLANYLDSALCNLYKDVHRCAGTPGSAPESFADLADVATLLDRAAVPPTDRKLVLEPGANWKMADALKGLFLQQKVEGFVGRGYLGTLAGFDILMDQNIKSHTKGAWDGTDVPLVNDQAIATAAYNAESQDLVTDGWSNTTNALREGDVVTIADVYDINPISQASLSPQLKQFVVNAAVTAGSGDATLVIEPAIIFQAGTGGSSLAAADKQGYDTVSALHVDSKALTLVTSANGYQNLAFHKNAFALVTVPLEIPDGVSFSAQENFQGVSIRVIKDFNILTDKDIIRLDVLFGVKTLYSDLAARLQG